MSSSLLLINTGLMSIGPLTKKLLQKHRPVSYSKKQRNRALSPRSLTESSRFKVLLFITYSIIQDIISSEM